MDKTIQVDETILWSIINDGINLYKNEVLKSRDMLKDNYFEEEDECKQEQNKLIWRVVRTWMDSSDNNE